MTRPQSAAVLAAIADIKSGVTWRDAAALHGVNQSSIKRAIDRANAPVCKCCGRPTKGNKNAAIL